MAASEFNSSEDESSQFVSSINITPFVDVVLVLLVIFIVTAPMLVKEVLELKLPQTKTGESSGAQTLGIAINRNGNILLNGKLVDLSTLKTETEKLKTLDPLVQAVIAADLETQYGYVVKVIDVLKQVGLEKFAVQIEKVTNEFP